VVDKQVEKFESWIRDMFAQRQRSGVCYHNLHHAQQIAEQVTKMGNYYQLEKMVLEDLYFAAWMHDVGYWEAGASGHEVRGAEIAERYLIDEMRMDKGRVERIQSLILSTVMPQNPQNLLEEIICDADLFHLGSEAFFNQTLLLKSEIEKTGQRKIPLIEWLSETRDFMTKHHYHTDYAKSFFQPVKERNLDILDRQIRAMEEDIPAKSKVIKKEKKKSERGIETMFRITSTNHLELSALADNKANIMISVNSIIISIVVTVLIRKLEEFPNYIVPTVMLVGTCLTAMVFAILATRPKVTSRTVNKADVQNKKGNLLYFGNFHELSLDEYKEGMHSLMEDGSYLYDSMITDIYFLGEVLAKKYRLLRKSYNIFMFGFVVSVISFLVATFFFDTQQY
jgi:hypothetical protein